MVVNSAITGGGGDANNNKDSGDGTVVTMDNVVNATNVLNTHIDVVKVCYIYKIV